MTGAVIAVMAVKLELGNELILIGGELPSHQLP